MKLSWLLTFNAIAAALFGIPAVLLPGSLYSIYGLNSTAGAQLVMQLFGSTLIAEALSRSVYGTSRPEIHAKRSRSRCSLKR